MPGRIGRGGVVVGHHQGLPGGLVDPQGVPRLGHVHPEGIHVRPDGPVDALRGVVQRHQEHRVRRLGECLPEHAAVAGGEQREEIVQVLADRRVRGIGEGPVEADAAGVLGQHAAAVLVEETAAAAPGVVARQDIAGGRFPGGVMRAPGGVELRERGRLAAGRFRGVGIGRRGRGGAGGPQVLAGGPVAMPQEIAQSILAPQPRLGVGDGLRGVAARVSPAVMRILAQDHVAHVVVGRAVDAEQVVGLFGDDRQRPGVGLHVLGHEVHVSPLEAGVEHVGLEALIDEVVAARREDGPVVDVFHGIGAALPGRHPAQRDGRLHGQAALQAGRLDHVLPRILPGRIESPAAEPLCDGLGPLGMIIARPVFPGDRLVQVGPLVNLVDDRRHGEGLLDHALEVIPRERIAGQGRLGQILREAAAHVPPGDAVRAGMLPLAKTVLVGAHVMAGVEAPAREKGTQRVPGPLLCDSRNAEPAWQGGTVPFFPRRRGAVRVAGRPDRSPAAGGRVIPADSAAAAQPVAADVGEIGLEPRRAQVDRVPLVPERDAGLGMNHVAGQAVFGRGLQIGRHPARGRLQKDAVVGQEPAGAAVVGRFDLADRGSMCRGPRA